MQVLLKIFLALGRIGDRLARIELRQEMTMGLIEDVDQAVQALAPAVRQLVTAATSLEQRIGQLGLTAEQTNMLQGDLDALKAATSSVQEVTAGLDATDPAPAPTGAGAPASATPGADGTAQPDPSLDAQTGAVTPLESTDPATVTEQDGTITA